jgi:hypothetical protein
MTVLLVALSGVTSSTAEVSSAAADCVVDGEVRAGAIFNQPHWEGNGGDDKIHRHIVCLIDGTPGGEEIRVASYHFAHKDIKNALLDAYERGYTSSSWSTGASSGTPTTARSTGTCGTRS